MKTLLLIVALTIDLVTLSSLAQVTRIVKKNVFLSRRKRYLAFPMKSNLVLTMSLGKPLMIVQPRGFVLAAECDVPFPLPSDTRLYKKLKGSHIQKREILTGFESAFNDYGLNGTTCVQRMICESEQIINNNQGSSLVKNIISAIFQDAEISPNNNCDKISENCPFSFLEYILRSLINR